MSEHHSMSAGRLTLLLAGSAASAMTNCSRENTWTVSETTEISSLASCTTYSGAIYIANVSGTIDLTGMETIVGEIEYENGLSSDITIHSSTLKNITAQLTMTGDSTTGGSFGALNVSLPALENIPTIDIASNWDSLSLNTNPNLSISGHIFIQGNEGLKTLLLEDLKIVNNTASIDSNTDLDFISMSAVDVGQLIIRDNGRGTSLSLPKLERLGGASESFYPDEGSIFQDIVNISMPLIREAHINDSTESLYFTTNLFPELYLPQLEIANCTLSIDNNNELNDLRIPRLSYVKDLEIHANPRLLNFTANLLKKADKINMTGLFSNVEFFSLEIVTGDFYLIGDDTMDCSWYNEHFLNKIVKGPYKCVGNHTNPSEERKPSTPTDEAQLEAWGSGNGRGPGGSNNDTKDKGSGGGNTGGLSTGEMAGIGVGVSAAVLAALGVVCWFCIRKRKKQQPKSVIPPLNTNLGVESVELHGESGISRTAPGNGKGMPLDRMSNVEELPNATRSELPAV